MLKVELTENYAGVIISGDYDDLDNLYDSIHYFIKDEPNSLGEYFLQNHLYGFLYDVRHAYQGDREVTLIDNSLDELKRQWHGIKKKDVSNYNVYYSFNYLLPDILLDMIIIKYFIRNIDKKNNDIYNPNINMVNYFYSLVLNSLKKMLTEIKFNKVKKGIINAFVYDKTFIPQWFESVTIDYAKMSKNKREKEFMHIVDLVYNYMEYGDYYNLKKELEKYANENNCSLDDLHYGDYPSEIVW